MYSNIKLEIPSVKYKDSYIKAVIECQADADKNDSSDHYDNVDVLVAEADFYSYIVRPRLDRADIDKIPQGKVPEIEYWIIDGGGYAGRIKLYTSLNAERREDGGHIGYDVIPSKRRRGYAKQALALVIEEAREMGIDEIIAACYADNVGSRKSIENAMEIFGGKVLKLYRHGGKENIQYSISCHREECESAT